MPTGGVSLDNCVTYLEAGADGLGVGSQLFDKTYIRDKNWKALSEHFKLFVKKINKYTGN
jgi:2-dehydro-3-deoxyphosphogluconate aldolase/(4S)-4-hydroxy-2-oxoglutarate aldolase